MGYYYFPLLKTRKAELNALTNIDKKILDNILPIFELTKSDRSSKSNPNASVFKNIEKIKDIMGARPFILDPTTIVSISNIELGNFLEEYNGFDNWVRFIEKIKKDYSLNIIPTIIFNPYVLDDVKKQIKKLLDLAPYIAFRFPSSDIEYVKTVTDMVTDKNKLILIYDLESDPQTKIVFGELSKCKTIIIGSSFPKQFTGDYGEKPEYMWKLMNSLKAYTNIYYGDYSSICPSTYDTKAYQWRARIDFIQSNGYTYYREEKAPSSGKTSLLYIDLAKKVCNDSSYKNIDCWGNKMVTKASEENPEQSAPNFWISVRVNMYINYILTFMKDKLNEMNDLDI